MEDKWREVLSKYALFRGLFGVSVEFERENNKFSEEKFSRHL